MDIPPLEPNKQDKFSFLVQLFLKKEKVSSFKERDWLRERSAAKILMNKYSDFSFFYSLTHLQNKFNSLFGLSVKYVPNLDQLYESYIIEKTNKKTFTLSDKPVIIFNEVKTVKNKSLLEFLHN